MKNIKLLIAIFAITTAAQSLTITKYQRSSWGHWTDKDKDCQNERAEILIKQSTTPVGFKTNKRCIVINGRWIGPYTNNTYTSAADLDIDHIVPLKEAHLSGANFWNKQQKKTFANDYNNLLAVDKRQNRKKGAKDPANYMPPFRNYHCKYIKKWTEIKQKYQLSTDIEEKKAIKKVLKPCF